MANRFRHTVSRELIGFEMGGEDYTAVPVLAPDVLGELVDLQNDLAGIDTTSAGAFGEVKAVLAKIFDLACEPESATRIRERLDSRTNSFDLAREVMPTITSLVEEYTGRPLPPSLPSSTSSPNGGTSSTDGAPSGELTLSTSTPPGS